MRYKDLLSEDGRIVKGVNTTVDVGVGQIPIEARKFGNTVDKDGRPPTLSKKVKGSSTNVLFNLDIAEDKKFTDLELAIMEGGHSLDQPTPTIQMLARKWKVSPKEILTQVKKGVKVEAEHTTDFDIAMEIALDHINEDPKYYDKLKKVEEADGLGEIASSSQIYVDMDGVLADFFGEWARLMDVEHFTQINKKHDIDDALQKIRDTDDFWLRLPMLPEAKNLLNLIKQVKGSYNICSSPLADDPNSEKHKRTWIEQNLKFFPPDNVYITHDKAQYATNQDGTPNILIDDYGVNIRKWEAAGGIGFKYKDHKFERTADAIKQHMQEPVEENFADGKVKGKSRPGRVKRSGASCNGSVTALRKRAKNASGEKAKMYHWCANMKSGKKK